MNNNRNFGKTTSCGKVMYDTRRRAKRALRLVGKLHKEDAPNNIYKCPACGGYHLTTEHKKKYRYRKRNGYYTEKVSEELRELRENVKSKM